MRIEKIIKRCSLAGGVFVAVFYLLLSFFLPFSLSMQEISSILSFCAILFICFIFIFFASTKIFTFRKFEREITSFVIISGIFYLLSLSYSSEFFRSIGRLKARRLTFIAIDIIYSLLAALLIFMLVKYFISKFSQVQRSLFYFLIFLFIISLEIPILSIVFYIFVFFYFFRMPWLIAISHTYRKTLLTCIAIFWFLYLFSPLSLLERFELFTGSPRLLLGTEFQIRFNLMLLVFFVSFTFRLTLSLIETSRTLRSKTVLVYFLTSLIPVSAILLLLLLSYINIAIFFKSFVDADKFLQRLDRHCYQLLNQPGLINIIKYSSDHHDVENRINLNTFGVTLQSEIGAKPFFKLQYEKKGIFWFIVTSDFPQGLNPYAVPPDWYFNDEKLPTATGFKAEYVNIFTVKIDREDRLFIKAENEVYYMSIHEYSEGDLNIYLYLFYPMSEAVTNYLQDSFGINSAIKESAPDKDKSLLSMSFHIRNFNTGEVEGSVKFSYYNSLGQILFTSFEGSHEFNRFLIVFRDSMFVILIIFIFIILILSLIGRRINRGMRTALQTIIFGMRKIGEGNLDYKIEMKTRDEYYRLANSINDMTSDIKEFMEDRVEKERLKAEVMTAYTIQRSILPEKDPVIKNLEISSYINPAEEVGGDFYDYIVQDNGKLGIIIGDVSGHGVSAGMLMAMAKSCLYNQLKHSLSVEKVMESMNDMVFDTVQKRLLMTFLYADIDLPNKKIEWSNAGHHYPYILKRRKNSLTALELSSYPLGVRKDIKFKKKSFKLQKNDFIIFYSDGIIEQYNREDELFGFDRLENVILKSNANTSEDMKNRILSEVDNWAGDVKRVDDITLIVLKII